MRCVLISKSNPWIVRVSFKQRFLKIYDLITINYIEDNIFFKGIWHLVQLKQLLSNRNTFELSLELQSW